MTVSEGERRPGEEGLERYSAGKQAIFGRSTSTGVPEAAPRRPDFPPQIANKPAPIGRNTGGVMPFSARRRRQ
jgi:hypothetical protein